MSLTRGFGREELLIDPKLATVDGVADDPQVRFNQTLVPFEHPVRSSRTPRPPARFSATPAQLRAGAPLVGEHAEGILPSSASSPPKSTRCAQPAWSLSWAGLRQLEIAR